MNKLKIQKRKQGLSLIEVILVLAIMAIVATIAVPQISKYMNKANESKVVSAILELNNTSLLWSTENSGDIPPNIETVLNEYGDTKKLNINLKSNGDFSSGNIKGRLIYNDGEIFAKIDSDSKAFKNKEIKVR